MATKYYAVKIGKVRGIFDNWNDCKDSTSGYPGAKFKSFSTKEEAENYLVGQHYELKDNMPLDEVYAFVDGSFNPITCVYGYGGYLYNNGKKIIIQGSDDDEEMASMRNVAGEILGCMTAVNKAISLGLKELTIYYDYTGIEYWATGAWQRNKEGTKAYYKYMQSVKDKINIKFVHVKGHTGIEGNEEADRLAKEAVGISS